MRKLLTLCALATALAAAPVHAEEKTPPFGPLLASFQATTAVSTYYAFCKPKDVTLSETQLINLATNNILLRSLVSGYLLGQNKDVQQPRMIAFVQSSAVGVQLDTITGLKQQGCDGDVAKAAKAQLPKMADSSLQKQLPEQEVKLTAEQARKFLDSMAIK